MGASGAELMRELSAQPVPYLGNAQELVQMRLRYSVYCIVTWYIYTRQALHGKAARVAAPRVVPAVTAAARRNAQSSSLDLRGAKSIYGESVGNYWEGHQPHR